jgi:hypothetical protein
MMRSLVHACFLGLLWQCAKFRPKREAVLPRRKLTNIPRRKIGLFDRLWGLQGSADRVRGLHAFRHDPRGGCPGVSAPRVELRLHGAWLNIDELASAPRRVLDRGHEGQFKATLVPWAHPQHETACACSHLR